MITLFKPNLDERSHCVFGNSAIGVPQLSVLITVCPRVVTSAGIFPSDLDQNHALMNWGVRSKTYLDDLVN
jgi:hypothetical protein